MNSSIIVADDHPMFREATVQLLKRIAPNSAIIMCSTLKSTYSHLRSNSNVGTVFLDLALSDSIGLEGVQRLKNSFPNIIIVVVSASEDLSIIKRAIELGVRGFIPKSEPMITMLGAYENILKGERWFPKSYTEQASLDSDTPSSAFNDLTPTQLKVLLRLRSGKNNKEIADSLFVTEATVKAHITAIFRKLGVKNRTQAVLVSNHYKLT